MTMRQLILWALLLVMQNASFTWVSRARNSGSDWYHAFAAVFSNGIWFLAMFTTFDYYSVVRESGDVMFAIGIGVVYVVATVFGSVFAGKFLRTYVEKGKRRVGHYDQPADPAGDQIGKATSAALHAEYDGMFVGLTERDRRAVTPTDGAELLRRTRDAGGI